MSGFDFQMVMPSCDGDADLKKSSGTNSLIILSAID